MFTEQEQSSDRIFYENLQFNNNYSVNFSWQNSPTHFPTHWHTVGEIILADSSDSLFCVQGKEYLLEKGDILFIWPGELHSTIRAKSHHLIIQYYGHLLNTFSDLVVLQNKVLSRHFLSCSTPGSPAGEIARYMHQIQEIFQQKPELADTRMCLCFYRILLAFYDYCSTNADSFQSGKEPRLQTFQTISRACCYISENCERDLSLDEVAKYVGVSKFYLSHSFKEYTQKSFSEYLAECRIRRAILLFENPEISIAEAAFQSGFGSIASFNRCFRKEKNCTPSEYRNMYQML